MIKKVTLLRRTYWTCFDFFVCQTTRRHTSGSMYRTSYLFVPHISAWIAEGLLILVQVLVKRLLINGCTQH